MSVLSLQSTEKCQDLITPPNNAEDESTAEPIDQCSSGSSEEITSVPITEAPNISLKPDTEEHFSPVNSASYAATVICDDIERHGKIK